MSKNSEKEKKLSNFGKYSVVDKLELTLPSTEIIVERKSENLFSYYRKNSEGQVTNKIIPRKGKDIKIELAPVLPIHLPAKKTNDLMFLRLAQSIYVEKNSNIDILVQFPIEIGVFIINENTKDFFDCFTCEPMHSRFALYGNPEKGSLCMYAKVGILEENESEPYIYAIMKVSIKNQLNEGATIGKLVFPVTNHDIYYKDQSSEVHIDDIEATIKKETIGNVIEINPIPYSKKKESWNLAPRSEEKGSPQSFVMERGFD